MEWNRHIEYHAKSLVRLFFVRGATNWAHTEILIQVVKMFFLYWANRDNDQTLEDLVDYLRAINDP